MVKKNKIEIGVIKKYMLIHEMKVVDLRNLKNASIVTIKGKPCILLEYDNEKFGYFSYNTEEERDKVFKKINENKSNK